ncbi:hypothetical protein [Staphylococcus phage vB_ScaM-V1SC01]|nr:hypothetical protein [Staphylococcus phage vB_ScaM-V1SC01]WLY86772.1 hypothetical protein 355Saur083PP_00005 [Staphylococcus phage 355Saur083PP]
MLNTEYRYIVRTVDDRKYSYKNSYKALGSVYRDVMGNDYIEVTKWGKDKKVIIDTRHIVSIERW